MDRYFRREKKANWNSPEARKQACSPKSKIHINTYPDLCLSFAPLNSLLFRYSSPIERVSCSLPFT